MANDIAQKITELPEITAVAAEDVFAIVDDPDGTGKKTKKVPSSKVNQNFIRTAAEISAGVTPTDFPLSPIVYDVRRVGIVPNSTGARSANTTALKALLDPTTTGPVGQFIFPNTTGSDIYHFDDRIPCRDGIHIDLNNCTLNFTKTGDATDSNGAAIHFIKNCSIQNGKLDINYTFVAGSSTFNAIALAGRGDDQTDFQGLFDNTNASAPFGNIKIKNIEIDYTGGGNSAAIQMLGGLQNCEFENIRIEGNGTLRNGIVYEFGWATDAGGVLKDRQSSHAHNLSFKNIYIENMNPTVGAGIRLGGAFNSEIDGFKIQKGFSGIGVDPGESLFFRPWVLVDDIGTNRWVTMKNIVCSELESTNIDVKGASDNVGYLSSVAIPVEDRTDIYSFSIDGFLLDGTGATTPGFGILSSCGHTDIRNGQMLGVDRGIVLTNEAVHFSIKNVDIFDSEGAGMQVGFDQAQFSPARGMIGKIENCHIAGSGVGATTAAITPRFIEMLLVKGCRFGYETGHDNKSETTQNASISLTSPSFVVVKDCYTAGVTGTAYEGLAGADGVLINPLGIITSDARWRVDYNSVGADVGDANVTLTHNTSEKTQRYATALTVNRTVTLSTTDALEGAKFRVVRTGLGAFTLDVGGLKTIAASTAAFVDVEFDGAAWILTGFGLL